MKKKFLKQVSLTRLQRRNRLISHLNRERGRTKMCAVPLKDLEAWRAYLDMVEKLTLHLYEPR
jgi:hypothetical protein